MPAYEYNVDFGKYGGVAINTTPRNAPENRRFQFPGGFHLLGYAAFFPDSSLPFRKDLLLPFKCNL
jgi:hypothetical protein